MFFLAAGFNVKGTGAGDGGSAAHGGLRHLLTDAHCKGKIGVFAGGGGGVAPGAGIDGIDIDRKRAVGLTIQAHGTVRTQAGVADADLGLGVGLTITEADHGAHQLHAGVGDGVGLNVQGARGVDAGAVVDIHRGMSRRKGEVGTQPQATEKIQNDVSVFVAGPLPFVVGSGLDADVDALDHRILDTYLGDGVLHRA